MLEKIKEKFKKDFFARSLGIEIVEASAGYGKTRLKVTRDMLNGAGITHGAVVFAIADLAFAVAANTHDKIALGLNMNISYAKATKEGTILTAEAREDSLTNRTGIYSIMIRDETGDTVAVAQGVVYRLQYKDKQKDGQQ